MLFRSLICITQSPIAPLVFAGILLSLSSLALWKFWKSSGPLSLETFIAISIVFSPFILPPLILSIPMISTPLVNLGSLSAWAFIGISALICYSYKKFNTLKQASVDEDTSGNELSWHPDSFQSDPASLTQSSSLSDSNSSFVSTQSTEGASEGIQTHNTRAYI